MKSERCVALRRGHGRRPLILDMSRPTVRRTAVQAGFFDEYGNYQLRSVAVDYKDAWLESLPADMGNVNVSEGAAQSASGSEAQPQDQDDIEAQEAEELTRLRRRIVDLLLPSGKLPVCSSCGSSSVRCHLERWSSSCVMPCRDCPRGAAAAERSGTVRRRRCRGEGPVPGAAAGAAR